MIHTMMMTLMMKSMIIWSVRSSSHCPDSHLLRFHSFQCYITLFKGHFGSLLQCNQCHKSVNIVVTGNKQSGANSEDDPRNYNKEYWQSVLPQHIQVNVIIITIISLIFVLTNSIIIIHTIRTKNNVSLPKRNHKEYHNHNHHYHQHHHHYHHHHHHHHHHYQDSDVPFGHVSILKLEGKSRNGGGFCFKSWTFLKYR